MSRVGAGEARQRLAMALTITDPAQNYIVVLKADALAFLGYSGACPTCEAYPGQVRRPILVGAEPPPPECTDQWHYPPPHRQEIAS